MTRSKETKRENFEVSPEQQAEIETLQYLTGSSSKKDAILLAVKLALHLANEVRIGNQIFVGQQSKNDLKRVVVLGIEKTSMPWMYLSEHAHPWKKQLYVKGRKLPAASVWTSSVAEKMSIQDAAHNWDLPVEAVAEIFEYCETHKDLLEMEAAEELRLLEQKGIEVVPPTTR